MFVCMTRAPRAAGSEMKPCITQEWNASQVYTIIAVCASKDQNKTSTRSVNAILLCMFFYVHIPLALQLMYSQNIDGLQSSGESHKALHRTNNGACPEKKAKSKQYKKAKHPTLCSKNFYDSCNSWKKFHHLA